jgi:broad specificity phosphatase PhoE
MIPNVFLIRHATPDWTRNDLVYHLPPGPPLTEQGRQEAQALGAFLLSQGVRQMRSSPLERCLTTAEIAAQICGITWQVDDSLIEMQPGETTESVVPRLWPIFEQAWRESHQHGPIALVTHGGPVNALLQKLGLDAETMAQHKAQFDHANPLPPAGAWLVERGEEDGWQLKLAFKPEFPAVSA